VAQVYEGLVYMDFSRDIMDRQGYGQYEELDVALLPPLYIAYRAELAEGTEVFHSNLRSRWESGERGVVDAMKTWAGLADQTRERLLARQKDQIAPLLNANFDLRRRIYDVGQSNIQMVETARSAGASAKFSGSGGAIVGTYTDEAMFADLESRLTAIGVRVLKPALIKSSGESMS
jgi:glucuronokinase